VTGPLCPAAICSLSGDNSYIVGGVVGIAEEIDIVVGRDVKDKAGVEGVLRVNVASPIIEDGRDIPSGLVQQGPSAIVESVSGGDESRSYGGGTPVRVRRFQKSSQTRDVRAGHRGAGENVEVSGTMVGRKGRRGDGGGPSRKNVQSRSNHIGLQNLWGDWIRPSGGERCHLWRRLNPKPGALE